MRTVIKGNPAQYDPNTPLVNTAVAGVRTALQLIREIRQEVTAVDGTMTEDAKYKRAKKADIEQVTDAIISDLQTKAKKFRADYQTAKTTNNEDLINSTGAKLLTNLKRQSDLLEGFIEDQDINVIGRMYANSRGDLIANIGQYCSYCEMPLAASLAVEHMLPKADFPDLAVLWTNFLLACPICNSKKNKKPSLDAAIIQAQIQNGTPNVTLDQVISAGYSLMLWPSDLANRYADFTTGFQYVLRKVDYGIGSFEYNVQALTTEEVNQRLSQNTIFLDSETGDQIVARFYDKKDLGPINHAVAIQYLRGLPSHTANNVAGVPLDLKNALLALGVNLGDPGATFTLMVGTSYPQDTNLSEIWTLTETRQYTIDTFPAKATITSPRLLPDHTDVPSKLLLGPLQLSIFPPKLAEHWGYQPFDWAFTSGSAVGRGGSRSEYDITLERKFELSTLFGVSLQIYLISTATVEIAINPVRQQDSGLQAAINRSIDYAGLNSIESGDLKASDRRIIKRTRAWFTAIQTIRRVIEAWGMGSPIRENMLMAAKHTMTGTGFWTIWYSLVVLALRNGDPVRDALLTILKDQVNFPGTR